MHALRVASAALALGLVAGSGPAAAGARQYGSRNLQQQGRRRRRPIDNSSVVQEAFDADGISLGYLHDPDANWTESQAGLMVLEGAPSFSYHRNASYYVVGEGDEDMDEVEFWHPHDADEGGKDMAGVHLAVAARFVMKRRENGIDTVRVKVVNAGWERVNEEAIDCDEDGDCPALILAETSNMVYRFTNDEAISLNGYMADWALENGWVLSDDFIKYYSYDLTYNGHWAAVPLVSDIRVLAYNKTTFETHGIGKPPAANSTVQWSWEDFVGRAGQITEATGEPGWYVRGSSNEELKLSFTIARNWGATLYREGNNGEVTADLGENFVEAMNATIKAMLDEGWMSRDFFSTNTTAFDEWVEEDLGDPTEGLDADSAFCCVESVFSPGSLLGMAIVPPASVKDLLDDDIALAHVPGRYGFLGGSGLFVSDNAPVKQQRYAWGLLTEMIQDASFYGLLQTSPPPFEHVLQKESPWSTEEWAPLVEQIHLSVPTQYPQVGFEKFPELERANPFRTMWMEMAYKDVNASLATERATLAVQEVLTVKCTGKDHNHASCRACTPDDYSYNFTDCDPKTQTHVVKFFYDPPGDEECYEEDEMPPDVMVACDHVETSSGFGIAIIIVSCFGGVLAISSAVLVYVHRDHPVIKFSQPKFCVLFSLGVAGLCLSNLALVGENTVRSCISRFSIWGIAFDLAFGALFSKVYRVRVVVDNATRGRSRSRKMLLPIMAVVSLAVVVDLVVLAMWGAWGEYGPLDTEIPVPGSEIPMQMSQCARQACPWAITFFSFKVLLIVWGVYLAWISRRINYTLVEGREISWSIYLFAVLAGMVIFIASSGLKIEYWALAKAFVFSLSSCTALVLVLAPKLWAAHKQLEVDMSVLASSATSASWTRGTSVLSTDASVDPESGGGPWTVVCTHCNQLTEAKQGFPLIVNTTGLRRPKERSSGAQSVGSGINNLPRAMRAPRAAVGIADRRIRARFSGASTGTSPSADVNVCATLRAPPPPLVVEVTSSEERVPNSSASLSSAIDDDSVLRAESADIAQMELAFKDDRGGRQDAWMGVSRSVDDIESRTGARLDAKHRNDVIRFTRVITPEGLQMVAADRGGAPKKGSWRSHWRRSSGSGQSSASGHSDLDAASFRRSLQAQAAALRAALRGSTSSSDLQSGGQCSRLSVGSRGSHSSYGSSSDSGRGRCVVLSEAPLALDAEAKAPITEASTLCCPSVAASSATDGKVHGACVSDEGISCGSSRHSGPAAAGAGRPPLARRTVFPLSSFPGGSGGEGSPSDRGEGSASDKKEGFEMARPTRRLRLPWVRVRSSQDNAVNSFPSSSEGSNTSASNASATSIGMSSAASRSSVGSSASVMDDVAFEDADTDLASSKASFSDRSLSGPREEDFPTTPVHGDDEADQERQRPRSFSFNVSDFSFEGLDAERSRGDDPYRLSGSEASTSAATPIEAASGGIVAEAPVATTQVRAHVSFPLNTPRARPRLKKSKSVGPRIRRRKLSRYNTTGGDAGKHAAASGRGRGSTESRNAVARPNEAAQGDVLEAQAPLAVASVGAASKLSALAAASFPSNMLCRPNSLSAARAEWSKWLTESASSGKSLTSSRVSAQTQVSSGVNLE